MRKWLLAFSIASVTPLPAVAVDPSKASHEFKAGEAISIEPDKAYILVRTVELFGFRFVRIEGNDGRRVDRENLVELLGSTSIDKTFPDRVHLMAVKPGTYWLYGQKTSYWLDGPWLNCLCMGTVRFEARPGIITDLGTIRDVAYETRGGKRADRRGKTHELVGNRDQRAIVVEPATLDAPIPAVLAGMPRRAADYRAAGWLPNIDGTRIDRISTLRGVIAYDRDKVIDLKTGEIFR